MASERDLADQLLRRAREDLAAVEAMVPVGTVSDAIVVFLAQQAVEKSLKAVLAARAGEFPFIHDIDRLGELCAAARVQLPDELDGADRLTPYATGFRYDEVTAGGVDRDAAMRWARAAVRWARESIADGGQGRESEPPDADRGESQPSSS
jgi:HEPN domain-containing protein